MFPLSNSAIIPTPTNKLTIPAEALYIRAFTIRYQQRGTHHLETAESLHDFARLYEERNLKDQALSLYQQALDIRERGLGLTHPRTLDTRSRYARLLRTCGRSEEAVSFVSNDYRNQTTRNEQ